jgi:hypothetical protein
MRKKKVKKKVDESYNIYSLDGRHKGIEFTESLRQSRRLLTRLIKINSVGERQYESSKIGKHRQAGLGSSL